MMPKLKNSQQLPVYSLSVLFTLYLAQGLPVGFMTQALPALLRYYGVSLTQIGLSGLLMLPWAIKFLWAPIVDKVALRQSGHYRSWILLTQFATILCLIFIALQPVENLKDLSYLWIFFISLFVMNICCATQDIATDGLAVNILNSRQVHWGNTFQVMGSRFGFLFGGGAVLYSIEILSWQSTFILLALGVSVNTIPIILYRENSFKIQRDAPPKSIKFLHQIKEIYFDLWKDSILKKWLLVLITYKIADGLSGPILKPMMVDMGLSLGEIGLYVTMLGAIAALIGAGLAGWLMRFKSQGYMLIVFSLCQILAFVYYFVLAYLFEQHFDVSKYHLYFANMFEEFCAAMSLVAMLSLIMNYSRKNVAGTDFTVQVALMTLISGVLYTIGGVFTDYLGYSTMLAIILCLSCLCLLPKVFWYRVYHTSI